MKYTLCKAGATRCAHKRNSDIGVIVCGDLNACDGHGNPCIFRKEIEVT